MINMKNKKRWISLLNFEGDVFKVFKKQKNSDNFDIVDFKGFPIEKDISANKVLSIYDGIEQIKTSEGRLYNIAQEHPNAKPERENLLNFLGLLKIKPQKLYTTISVTLSDKQQADFDEWREAIKYIYGEYGYFDWIITPSGIGTGIKVKSHLTGTILDVSHEEDW